tara:strand:+ start:52688 stop:53110 length:423 start_codon:yes stop_codon:yes gene_type:complete
MKNIILTASALGILGFPAEIDAQESKDVPQSVQDFRKNVLDKSQNFRNYALVEVARGMDRYLVTHPDGSKLQQFGESYLGMNRKDLNVHLNKEKKFKDFMVGFNFKPGSFYYIRSKEILDQKDCNRDLVITAEELYNSCK